MVGDLLDKAGKHFFGSAMRWKMLWSRFFSSPQVRTSGKSRDVPSGWPARAYRSPLARSTAPAAPSAVEKPPRASLALPLPDALRVGLGELARRHREFCLPCFLHQTRPVRQR